MENISLSISQSECIKLNKCFIHSDEIAYCQAAKNYTVVKLFNGQTTTICKRLGALEVELPNYLFCRLNKSAIINVKAIAKVQKRRDSFALLKCGTQLNVTRRYLNTFFMHPHVTLLLINQDGNKKLADKIKSKLNIINNSCN